uniref:Uncharacterized protein n=1 Tax=Rhizophora mucronata TaxID=61149 RepID=A0A2P2IQC6_RHIMU
MHLDVIYRPKSENPTKKLKITLLFDSCVLLCGHLYVFFWFSGF